MKSSDQKLFPFLPSVSFIHRVSVYRVPGNVLREAWIVMSRLILLPRSPRFAFGILRICYTYCYAYLHRHTTHTHTHTCVCVVVPRYTINHLNGVCRREITANLVQSRMLRVLYESIMDNMKQRILQVRGVIRAQFRMPLIHWLHDCLSVRYSHSRL